MTSKSYTSMEALLASSNRVPFNADDAQFVLSTIKGMNAEGKDLLFHPSLTGSPQEHFDEGLLMLTSEFLECDLVFVKVSAGRGLFGGQKSKIQAFVGSVYGDRMLPTKLFNNLLTALASVRSIYRNEMASA